MRVKRTLRIAAVSLLVLLLLGGAALGAMLWTIHESVQDCCALAQDLYPHPGDDVAALVAHMNSDGHSFRDRNRAIWGLGRLRDARALPALRGAYTGQPCDHEARLCQYELAKAIRLCGGTPDPPRRTRQ